jgi:hypothetical protein
LLGGADFFSEATYRWLRLEEEFSYLNGVAEVRRGIFIFKVEWLRSGEEFSYSNWNTPDEAT